MSTKHPEEQENACHREHRPRSCHCRYCRGVLRDWARHRASCQRSKQTNNWCNLELVNYSKESSNREAKIYSSSSVVLNSLYAKVQNKIGCTQRYSQFLLRREQILLQNLSQLFLNSLTTNVTSKDSSILCYKNSCGNSVYAVKSSTSIVPTLKV